MKQIRLLAVTVLIGSVVTLGGASAADEAPNAAECERLCPGIACPANCKMDGPQTRQLRSWRLQNEHSPHHVWHPSDRQRCR